MMAGFTGGCLCGAVKYDTKQAPSVVANCYCDDCRRSSGTSHGTHLMVPEEAVIISGEVACYSSSADSGNMINRHFCPTCGSAVYTTNNNTKGLMFLRASSLDDLEVAKPQVQVYASRIPSWALIDETLPAFPEMPDPEAMQKMMGV